MKVKCDHRSKFSLIFFRLLLSNCLNWKIYCDDHTSLSSHTAVQIWIISYIFHTNTHDASNLSANVGENFCSISAQKTTKQIFVKTDLFNNLKTPSRTKVHALHYANELLVRVRLAFLKLLQTRKRAETTRNYQKQVLVMIKHCLGNSQINSIPE